MSIEEDSGVEIPDATPQKSADFVEAHSFRFDRTHKGPNHISIY